MSQDSNKNIILFVDDEKRVLNGIKRLLYAKRDQWQMKFVTGAQEALDIMQELNVDVLVTDVYMPQIDGLELLKRVKSKYPMVFRIGLSGNANKNLNLEALHLVHQYLPKPCKKATIITTLERSLALKNIIKSDNIRKIVSQLNTLPSLPAMYNKVINMVNNSGSSIRDVGRVVTRDISMSTKVLQMIDSAYFGIRNKVTDPVQACVYLGMDTIKSLVLTVKIFDKFKEANVSERYLNRLWDHSLNVAQYSQKIAENNNLDKETVRNYWTAGLLHDIGKLVIAANFPAEFQKIEDLHKDGLPLLSAEDTTLGANHGEIGAYLLALWGLPTPLIPTAAFHHYPEKYNANDMSTVNVVHFANAIDHYQKNPDKEDENIEYKEYYFESVGLAEELDKWEAICQEVMA